MDSKLQAILYSILDAARTLQWVNKNSPGEDMGQDARAVCLIEIREQLQTFDNLYPTTPFDCKASLEYYLKKHAVK